MRCGPQLLGEWEKEAYKKRRVNFGARMTTSLFSHFLGVCCSLYAIQLLRNIWQDCMGKHFGRNLLGLIGGLVAVILSILLVLGVDYVYPVGSAATPAMFFIRLCFLIPLAYLAAFLSSLFCDALIGRFCTPNIINHVAYLGITLIILAPVARDWYFLFMGQLDSMA